MSWFVEITREGTFKAFATDLNGNSGVWNFSSRADAERWAQAWDDHDMSIVGDRAVTSDYFDRRSNTTTNGSMPDFSLQVVSFTGWDPPDDEVFGPFSGAITSTWLAPNGLWYGLTYNRISGSGIGTWSRELVATPVQATLDIILGYTNIPGGFEGVAFHSYIIVYDHSSKMNWVARAGALPVTGRILPSILYADPFVQWDIATDTAAQTITTQHIGTLNWSIEQMSGAVTAFNSHVNRQQLGYFPPGSPNSNTYTASLLLQLGFENIAPVLYLPGFTPSIRPLSSIQPQ